MAGTNGNAKGASEHYYSCMHYAATKTGMLLGMVFFDLCKESFDRIWPELYRRERENNNGLKTDYGYSIAKRSDFFKSIPMEFVGEAFGKINPRILQVLSNKKSSYELDKLLDDIEDEVFVEAVRKTLRLTHPSQRTELMINLIKSLDISGVTKALLYAKDPAPNGVPVIEMLASRYNIKIDTCTNQLHGLLRLRNAYLGHAPVVQTLDEKSAVEFLNELRLLVALFTEVPSEWLRTRAEKCSNIISQKKQEVLAEGKKSAATTAKTEIRQNNVAAEVAKAQPQQNNGTVQRKDVSISPISEITKDTLRIVKATTKEERTAALKKVCCWGIIAFLVGIVYFKIFGVAPAGIIIWNFLLFASLYFFLFFPFFRYVCEKTEIESVKQEPKKAIRNTTTGLAGVFLVLILLTFALGGIPNLSAKASLKPVNPFKEVTVDVTGAEPYAYVEVINNSENEFLRQIAYEVTPNGTLKNGDVVKISAVYDKTAAAEAGVRIRKDSMTYKVEGAGTAIHSFNEIDQVAWERMLSQALDILETNLSTRSVNSFEDDLGGDVLSSWATVAWDFPELDRVYFLDRKSGNVNEGVSVNKCCLVFRSFTKTTSYGYELYPYNGYAYYSVFYDNLSSDENGATSVEMSMATLGRQAMPSIEKNYIGYISPLKETFAVEEIMVDDLLSMGYSVVIE